MHEWPSSWNPEVCKWQVDLNPSLHTLDKKGEGWHFTAHNIFLGIQSNAKTTLFFCGRCPINQSINSVPLPDLGTWTCPSCRIRCLCPAFWTKGNFPFWRRLPNTRCQCQRSFVSESRERWASCRADTGHGIGPCLSRAVWVCEINIFTLVCLCCPDNKSLTCSTSSTKNILGIRLHFRPNIWDMQPALWQT